MASIANKEDNAVCCLCSDSLPPSQFYKTNSPFYSSGRLPMCKTCFARKFKEYTDLYQSKKKAMHRMCMAFDVYFDENIFDKCAHEENVIGIYFRQLNIAQYKNKTYDDTIERGTDFIGDIKPVKERRVVVVDQYENVQEEEPDLTEKDIEKWGYGFEPEDYKVLNTHYKYLKSSNPRSDNNQEIFIMDCCYTKMQQLKAVREGRLEDYAKMTDLYGKSYKAGGLKAAGDGNINDDFTMGVTAETIEKYTPAEYYKNKSLYRDFDDLGSYAERNILRPLKNLIFGTKDKDPEWYVKDEEDTNDYDE